MNEIFTFNEMQSPPVSLISMVPQVPQAPKKRTKRKEFLSDLSSKRKLKFDLDKSDLRNRRQNNIKLRNDMSDSCKLKRENAFIE